MGEVGGAVLPDVDGVARHDRRVGWLGEKKIVGKELGRRDNHDDSTAGFRRESGKGQKRSEKTRKRASRNLHSLSLLVVVCRVCTRRHWRRTFRARNRKFVLHDTEINAWSTRAGRNRECRYSKRGIPKKNNPKKCEPLKEMYLEKVRRCTVSSKLYPMRLAPIRINRHPHPPKDFRLLPAKCLTHPQGPPL